MIFQEKDEFYEENFDSIIPDSTGIIKSKVFEKCVFSKCTFMNLQFLNCKFDECKFENCVISAANFTNSSFIDTAFNNSRVMGVDWTKTKDLSRLTFKSCQLDYSNFRFLDLKKTIMTDCTALDCDFTGTNFTEADLQCTNFEKSIFLSTNLTKANFKNAKNYVISPKFNTLKQTKFSMPEVMSLLDCLDIIVD